MMNIFIINHLPYFCYPIGTYYCARTLFLFKIVVVSSSPEYARTVNIVFFYIFPNYMFGVV